MPRGPVKSRYPVRIPHHPNLEALLSILEAGPLELAQAEPGLTYQTVWGTINSPKDPALRTAHLIVSSLRAIAAGRSAEGKSSLPLVAITVDSVFPLNRLPSTLRSKNISQATPKRNS